MQKKLYTQNQRKSSTECPTCGWQTEQLHTFEHVLSGGWQNEQNGSYTAIRTTPLRHSTLESQVLVPLAQSFIWSIAVALPTLSISVFMRWDWSAPLFVASSAILVSWIASMKRSESGLVKTEEFSYIGNERRSENMSVSESGGPLRLEIVHEVSGVRRRMQMMEIDDGVSEEKFVSFLKDVFAGKTPTRKNWTPEAKGFSRDAFDHVVSKMIDASVFERRRGDAVKLSENGKRTIKAMVRGGII